MSKHSGPGSKLLKKLVCGTVDGRTLINLAKYVGKYVFEFTTKYSICLCSCYNPGVNTTFPSLGQPPCQNRYPGPFERHVCPNSAPNHFIFFLLDNRVNNYNFLAQERLLRKMEVSGLISDPFTEFFGSLGSSTDEQWYALHIVVQGSSWLAGPSKSTQLVLHFESP